MPEYRMNIRMMNYKMYLITDNRYYSNDIMIVILTT